MEWVEGVGPVFHGWYALLSILVMVGIAGAYISSVLIGFNREEAKNGFRPEEF